MNFSMNYLNCWKIVEKIPDNLHIKSSSFSNQMFYFSVLCNFVCVVIISDILAISHFLHQFD